MEKLNLKTPITYYGGKRKMVNHILPLIPEHSLYAEPFAGGAAIFWAKFCIFGGSKISPKIVLFDLDFCTF